MEKLTNNTISILNGIKLITKDIFTNYHKLIREKEYSEVELKQIFEELNHDINLCNSLYHSLGNNPQEMQLILQYLNQAKALKYPIDDIEAILNREDLINYRMSKYIADILFSNPKVKINKTLISHPYAFPVISVSSADIINSLLVILNQYINDNQLSEDKRNYLKNIAYSLIFINPQIEEELANQEFIVNPEIEWHLTNVTDNLGISSIIAEAERSNIVGNIYNQSLNYIAYNYTSYDNKFLFMQILMRMCLIFYDTDKALEIRDKVLQDWHNKVYSEPNDILFSLAIKEIFSHIEEDKSRIIKAKKRTI